MELENEQKHLIQHIEVLLDGRRKKIRKTKIVLPDHIIHYEILNRLPAKSLVRFMLVCKSWRTLFSNSEFVKSHLTRQDFNMDQDLLIGQKSLCGHGVIIISHSKESIVKLGPLRSHALVGSINGIVCMGSLEGFCLWNPATGKIMDIFPPSCQPKVTHDHLIGFSWDHVLDDYKVVILCVYSTSKKLCIYSSRAASWTERLIPDALVPYINKWSYKYSSPCTIVRGHPYWISTDYQFHLHGGYKYVYVFKFEAQKNEIKFLPKLYSVCVSKNEFSLVNIKDCLAAMVYKIYDRDSLVDIFYLDDEESENGIWRKMYTIGPIDLHKRNWCRLSQCFKNGGEILVVRSGLLLLYDPKTQQTKSIRSLYCDFYDCYSYTPSLVCVQGMKHDAGAFIAGETGLELLQVSPRA